jgi:quercetin dioxygenase-like cupin family protein
MCGGQSHTLFLKADGTVLATGSNFSGQLGDGTNTNRSTPVAVVGLTNVVSVACASGTSLALKADGTVWGWGERAKLGVGTEGPVTFLEPIQIISLSNVSAISAGGKHSLALKQDGTVWAWGQNQLGQVGDGTVSVTGCGCRSTPVQSNVGSGNPVFGTGEFHGFAAKPSALTPAGANIHLYGESVSITFDAVTSTGTTSYTAVDTDSTGLIADGFAILSNSPAYDINTTATHSGNVTASVAAPGRSRESREHRIVPIKPMTADVEILYGDPGKEGEPFVMRIRELPGTSIPPHKHPVDEHLTVVQGTIYFAVSEKFDRAAMKEIKAGGYAFIPKGSTMYGYISDGAIVQVHGTGTFHIYWREGANWHMGHKTLDDREATHHFKFKKGERVVSKPGRVRIRQTYFSGEILRYEVEGDDGTLFMALEEELRRDGG